ncbi:MAG: SDR family oxidoreductase [Bacteroidia bacterium]|nr:SDR family oxidoreductase [Bacteroidia bacterium]
MKNILITGCSSGFGYLTAKYLAEKGHTVYATMRKLAGKNATPAAELKQFAKDKNLDLQVIEMDVTLDGSVQKAVAPLDRIDVLINNAGLGYGGPVEAFSSRQVLEQLDLNIVGTVRVAQAVLPLMRAQQSGLIIQVSSVAGLGAVPGFGVYHASKWGLEGLSEAMRYELAHLGIDVVLVEPGLFATHFLDNLVTPARPEIMASYPHIQAFVEGFEAQTRGAYADPQAPTDPMSVVYRFDELINMAPGSRPLRNIVGLDLGITAFHEATEPVRQQFLTAMGLSEWDGPRT